MSLYARLAWDGIRKNKRLYLPYILTCVGAVTMYYMMRELRDSPLLESMKGGGSSRMILGLGTWVIAVFSLLFLFYTYSFLIRRRQREFGLYHVLGLGKRHIALLCALETLFTAAIALVAGPLRWSWACVPPCAPLWTLPSRSTAALCCKRRSSIWPSFC